MEEAGECKEESRNPKANLNVPILCLISTVEAMDAQLLPATFRALEISLHLSPVSLSLLAACQGVAVIGSGPIWANMADSGIPRNLLLSCGAATWGLATLMLARADGLVEMMILRFINGAALGVLSPVVQSLIAEHASADARGKLFGVVEFSAKAVGEIGALFAITALSNQVIFGVAGWRFMFVCVALMSICCALLSMYALREPSRKTPTTRPSVLSELSKFRGYCRIRTFQVLVLQGMFGIIPWVAMSFSTLFFQYQGVGDLAAGCIAGMGKLGGAFGAVFGGMLGDALAWRNPHHGRAFAAETSVLLSVPTAAALFLVTQTQVLAPGSLGVLFFFLGFVATWANSGCNRPMLTQIVEPDSWGSVLAWHSCAQCVVGGAIGQGGIPFLAEYCFGYSANSQDVSQMLPSIRQANARALGLALATCTVFPWIVCFFCYLLLHITYPADAPQSLQGGAGSKLLETRSLFRRGSRGLAA